VLGSNPCRRRFGNRNVYQRHDGRAQIELSHQICRGKWELLSATANQALPRRPTTGRPQTASRPLRKTQYCDSAAVFDGPRASSRSPVSASAEGARDGSLGSSPFLFPRNSCKPPPRVADLPACKGFGDVSIRALLPGRPILVAVSSILRSQDHRIMLNSAFPLRSRQICEAVSVPASPHE